MSGWSACMLPPLSRPEGPPRPAPGAASREGPRGLSRHLPDPEALQLAPDALPEEKEPVLLKRGLRDVEEGPQQLDHVGAHEPAQQPGQYRLAPPVLGRGDGAAACSGRARLSWAARAARTVPQSSQPPLPACPSHAAAQRLARTPRDRALPDRDDPSSPSCPARAASNVRSAGTRRRALVSRRPGCRR